MHTSIGAKLFICKLDYCLKVGANSPYLKATSIKKNIALLDWCIKQCWDPLFDAKKVMVSYNISSNIYFVLYLHISLFFFLTRFTYRQVLHLYVGSYRTKYILELILELTVFFFH